MLFDKEKTIDDIILLEFKQFQATQNEGGRAECQDDFETFNIMRKSQYLAWDDDLIKSYYNDLLQAESKPWNLVTEKYARMMESTSPDEYRALADKLPRRNAERLNIQEEIIKIRVRQEEEFARQYPNLHDTARPIHTSEDTPWDTSFETYQRGELGTYSDETVNLYHDMIMRMDKNGENLSEKTVANMVKFYGFDSVKSADEYYAQK